MDQMKIYRVEQKNEEPVEVQIIRSSRRSMGLQVKADGTVCARVPMQVMVMLCRNLLRDMQIGYLRRENWFFQETTAGYCVSSGSDRRKR